MLSLKIHGNISIAVLKCYVIVVLGVIQQYNIYLKTAIFFREWQNYLYMGLAVALATWYNAIKMKLTDIIMRRRGYIWQKGLLKNTGQN